MSGLSRKQVTLIRSLYTRHGRKKHSKCVCEGPKCCSELIRKSPELIEFAVCEDSLDFEAPGVELFRVGAGEFRQLSASVNPQGVLIVARRPEMLAEDNAPAIPFVLLLDRVSDPGNMGTIIRSAKAAGIDEISLISGSADPFNEKVIRSSAGTVFSMGFREFETLDTALGFMKKSGYGTVYRTDPHAGESCFECAELFDHSLIVLGSEASGAAELPGSRALKIPMPGDTESLNVAQAATVILFEYVRRSPLRS